MTTVERAGVVRLSGPPGGAGLFAVPSRSRPGDVYRVAWLGDAVVCPCRGYGFRTRCWHQGRVVRALAEERLDLAERARRSNEDIGRLFDCGD